MTQKELIATIAGMRNEEQKKVFVELKKNGLTEKEERDYELDDLGELNGVIYEDGWCKR